MKIHELREKSPEELHHALREKREELRALRFKVAADEHTKVRDIRQARKTIAKILTLLNMGKSAPHKVQPKA